MRLRNLLLIVVALVMAGGTAYLVRGWLASERAAISALNRPAPARAAPHVLVAKIDLGVGQFIRPEHLRWQAWPEGSLSPAYVLEGKRTMDDFVGAVVRHAIAAGEPVTEGRVVVPGNSGFLAAVLPAGQRAMSMPVNLTSGISGFVFPGDRVDLILTHGYKMWTQSPKGEMVEERERVVSTTILRNMRVLAIDQQVSPKQGEPTVARTTTIEVTGKQAEIIAVAMDMGKLSLALRSLGKDENEDEDPFEILRPNPLPKLREANHASNAAERVESRREAALRGIFGFTLDSDVSVILAPPTIGMGNESGAPTVVIQRGSKSETAKEGEKAK